MSAQPFSLDREAVLDATIQPSGNPVDFATPPETIFLTGATGFVGAYLLHNLLRETRALIYCLVRADHPEHGFNRIRKNLSQYLLWQDSYTERIIPIIGDLKAPLFDLTPEIFQTLCEGIDVVYHCGSKLSYVAPYSYLKDANVGGTQEALRLATRHHDKPFHFVSSLGILLAYQSLIGGQEDNELDETKCPEIGYFQSKYVAERVVRIARDRGVAVSIHRIGLIVGDSVTGVSNPDDFVARIMVGCIKAGYAPDMTNAMDMTPVDYVSRAMTYLARQPESTGKVFHLLNPYPIHWSDIFERVMEAGYPLSKLPFENWVEAIETHADPKDNPLYPLLPFLQLSFASRMLGISDSHFNALGTRQTQAALAASNILCPEIDRALINTFLAQFVASGRLHPATVVAAPELALDTLPA